MQGQLVVAVELLKLLRFLSWIVLVVHMNVTTGGLSFYFCTFCTDASNDLCAYDRSLWPPGQPRTGLWEDEDKDGAFSRQKHPRTCSWGTRPAACFIMRVTAPRIRAHVHLPAPEGLPKPARYPKAGKHHSHLFLQQLVTFLCNVLTVFFFNLQLPFQVNYL